MNSSWGNQHLKTMTYFSPDRTLLEWRVEYIWLLLLKNKPRNTLVELPIAARIKAHYVFNLLFNPIHSTSANSASPTLGLSLNACESNTTAEAKMQKDQQHC